MNNQRIIDWVDGLFAGFTQTDKVREQKEELQLHMVDRVKDYMANSMDFDRAFATAKEDLGDLDELLASFDRKKKHTKGDSIDDAIEHVVDNAIRHSSSQYANDHIVETLDYPYEDRGRSGRWRFRVNHEGIVALSPFMYLAMGFMFGWWAWGWIIIPVSAILFSWRGKRGETIGHKLIAVSPFVYLFLGFTMGWWAWGWVIIPLSAILFGTPVIKIGRG